MNLQANTLKLLKQFWFTHLIVVLLLGSQFITLEHSTEHVFHVHSDYCLTFQTADASPSLVTPITDFQLTENQFEPIAFILDNTLIVPFQTCFFARAPPFFV